jgi:hypothetical protein
MATVGKGAAGEHREHDEMLYFGGTFVMNSLVGCVQSQCWFKITTGSGEGRPGNTAFCLAGGD